MGCFNIQDAISKNVIKGGEPVKFIFISKTKEKAAPVYITDNWYPISTIFDGNYDEYGSVEMVEQSAGLKVFEEYFQLNIEQILEIVRDNSRSPYSSCSPVMKIYKPADYKFFHSYHTKLSIENILKFSNKFIQLDENKLEYMCSDNKKYTLEFNFEEKTCSVHMFYLNYNDKQFNLSESYVVDFKHRESFNMFFEELYDTTKYMFGFEEFEQVHISKLLNSDLFVFSTEVFDYVLSESKLSKTQITKLKELELELEKLNLYEVDSDEYENLEWKIKDKDDIYRYVLPSFHYDFRRIYDILKLVHIKNDFTKFMLLMNFLQHLNIVLEPSAYASQEIFREDEYKWNLFCANIALKKYEESN